MIKAGCHLHSEWSYDGVWTLSELSSKFKQRGYRVLLMTEHDRGFSDSRFCEYRETCAKLSSETCLLVPGVEYSDASNVVHILVWGVERFLGENLPTLELLKRVSDANGLAVLAHPTRKNAWQKFEPSWIPYLLGVELWNRKTDGWAPSRTASALLKNGSLLAFAGMDFHNYRQFFPMALELNGIGESVTEAAVLQCLRSRCCRSTVFGRSINAFLSPGWRLSGLRTAEFGRRTAARACKTLKLV